MVSHLVTREAVAGAAVLLHCSCLANPREASSDERGLYSFRDLPPGEYTVSASYGAAKVSKLGVVVPRGAKVRVNFSIDPTDPRERRILPQKIDGCGTAEDFTISGTSSILVTQAILSEGAAGGPSDPVFGDAEPQSGGAGVAIHPNGDLIVAGWFLGTIDFGTGPQVSAGEEDLFVAALDSDGDGVWAEDVAEAEIGER